MMPAFLPADNRNYRKMSTIVAHRVSRVSGAPWLAECATIICPSRSTDTLLPAFAAVEPAVRQRPPRGRRKFIRSDASASWVGLPFCQTVSAQLIDIGARYHNLIYIRPFHLHCQLVRHV
ncbi:hypothetical protein HER10_EVM0009307 [Colletotrichum scovillei]|uniref:uncharacterized protein n=1 Tax=Colletotrichum scovillei TaxID=1209932 RepID=UPI0015C3FE24|nr:uncharacterized protein HER10_EVM0009307 [Colletotrichum scovillei]KAF4782223.1 hypothetical protein HER10_EVM0009307 [Colletotrichum scovillei]